MIMLNSFIGIYSFSPTVPVFNLYVPGVIIICCMLLTCHYTHIVLLLIITIALLQIYYKIGHYLMTTTLISNYFLCMY